jgi:hypothetical protein
VSGAELAARVTAARAALGDFRHEGLDALAAGPEPDWASWAHRLAAELRGLLDRPAAAAALDAAALSIMLAALDDAAVYREDRGGQACAGCDVHPDGLCEDRVDLGRAADYRALARELEAGQ